MEKVRMKKKRATENQMERSLFFTLITSYLQHNHIIPKEEIFVNHSIAGLFDKEFPYQLTQALGREDQKRGANGGGQLLGQ